ncbi:zinc finger protein 250-like isoform X2 [Etheostoma cragini]|uniref:zinc finger protein 250-like isoform X2 n=1 Tax=Etheostoma cragini TaxID=417921 RepID=UPI00155E625D|nr:zinc finger protein 250-like isoform X2 [Etheostoma cragini]
MGATFEERLCEEVRRYPHLYDWSLTEYNDSQRSLKSWREIAQTLGKNETVCRQKWRSLRDRYVKAKKKQKGRSGKTGRCVYIISILDWLSGFIKHRSTDATRTLKNCSMDDTACTTRGQVRSCPWTAENPHLPLSSVRLLVPPLRLMSACMWQVAQERNVDQYNKLAEFIMLVTEMVPELLNYKQKTQLILGLRARLILELLKRMDEVDCKDIQDHLISFQQTTTNLMHEEDLDGEVETSKSAFVELVQTLLEDQSGKENFFKEVFPVQYGACFDTTLQILVWEFFHQLEEFLPVPRFSQVGSMFDISSLDEEFKQFLSDPEDLKRILQHQQEWQKLTKSFSGEFTFMSDAILSTLASKQTSAASEDQDQIMDPEEGKQDTGKSQGRNREQSVQTTVKQENSWRPEDSCEDDEETDNSSIEPDCGLSEYGLSPLTSSPCSEEAAEPGESGGRADVSLPFSEDSVRANENICLECGKTFASRSTLKHHRVVHTSARPFKCTQCDKTYKSRKDLNFHLRSHSNRRPHPCNLCEKKFGTRSELKVHLRRHSGERPFGCSYCDKRFSTNGEMKSHVRIHTGERPYACHFCNKRFTQPYMLTVHIRRHKKEKPYLCSTCGMSFRTSGALRVHTRKHTGERPNQCDICGKGFTTAMHLTQHRQFHTGERPYACSQCDISFKLETGLKRHMKTHKRETLPVFNMSQDLT